MRLNKTTLLSGSAASIVFGIGVLSMPSTPKAAARAQVTTTGDLVVLLGKTLFNDTTLSNPAGMACVTCHDPSTGFSYPESDVNQNLGPVAGIVTGRFGFRKPPSAAYAAYLPTGLPTYDPDVQAYVGGLFYDGRAADTIEQAKAPFINPNEMNDLLYSIVGGRGGTTVHGVGSPAMVVSKIQNGPSGALFKRVYGPQIFQQPTATVYGLVAQSIAVFEKSAEVSPFTSKYDAYLEGKATLTTEELRGMRIVTGTLTGRPGGVPFQINAHCMDCHGISSDLSQGPDLWTNSCFANLGVPKNLANPFYRVTDPTNPGYNPLGKNFIDYGLGDFLYPLMGKSVADLPENDPLQIDGTFKTPTLRNVDKRPYPGFVKSYMHNGVFKSLEQVVHFYNTRNLTTFPGEVIDFTRANPYQGLIGTPLWPQPEWPSPTTLINPAGLPNFGDTETGGEQIGNMGLSGFDEGCIVVFLQTLTDGYFVRMPLPKP